MNSNNSGTQSRLKEHNGKGLSNLAQAIILQSIEDLWDDKHRNDSRTFFGGEGFTICAQMSGMKAVERIRLLNLLRKSLNLRDRTRRNYARRKNLENIAGRGR
ncbi:MAG: hypothetical protein AB1390_11875 [Nitrospirota bacterium]